MNVPELLIRPLRWPDDSRAILTLNTHFESEVVYDVIAQVDGFKLVERQLNQPLSKNYDLADELDTLPGFERVLVAEYQQRLVGLSAFRPERWNRRANLVHFYLDDRVRGQGIGRQLMLATLAEAQKMGMRALWLETQNINYAAIQFYQKLGFKLCGLDISLYDPQSFPDEIALYFAYVFKA